MNKRVASYSLPPEAVQARKLFDNRPSPMNFGTLERVKPFEFEMEVYAEGDYV